MDYVYFRVWNEEAPSGALRAVVKKITKKDEDKFYIEVHKAM